MARKGGSYEVIDGKTVLVEKATQEYRVKQPKTKKAASKKPTSKGEK